MSNSSLQFAAATCPTMTTAEQAKAWQALVKAPDAGGQYQSARAMLLAVAHQIVGGDTTDKKPFGPAAFERRGPRGPTGPDRRVLRPSQDAADRIAWSQTSTVAATSSPVPPRC